MCSEAGLLPSVESQAELRYGTALSIPLLEVHYEGLPSKARILKGLLSRRDLTDAKGSARLGSAQTHLLEPYPEFDR